MIKKKTSWNQKKHREMEELDQKRNLGLITVLDLEFGRLVELELEYAIHMEIKRDKRREAASSA